MIKDKKFFYKARRADNGKSVIGRVGSSQSTEDGNEKTTYFYEYIGDICPNSDWNSCIVVTNTIEPVEM